MTEEIIAEKIEKRKERKVKMTNAERQVEIDRLAEIINNRVSFFRLLTTNEKV